MKSFLKKILQGDTIIWVVYALLCFVSVLEMYSASSTLAYKAATHTAPVMQHIRFLLGGAILAVVVQFIPGQYIRFFAYAGLAISTVLLLLVPFIGVSENDSARWIEIMGIRFQPSEIAKLSVVIVCADLLARIKDKNDEKTIYRWIMLAVGIQCALIVTANLSTALLLFGVVMVMMFVGNISFKRIAVPLVVLGACGVMGYFTVKAVPYDNMPSPFRRAYTWVGRIDRFLTPETEESKYIITDENRQEQHSQIAIARSGMIGCLPGNSVERDFLPLAYADYIFSIIVEELGLIGAVFVIGFYLILLFRAGMIAAKTRSVYAAMAVIGLSLMIVVQAFISMGVAVNLGPVTGQPLPLISRGGTSILITSLYFGIILGISREVQKEYKKTEQTPDQDENIMETIDINELPD